ncbi:CD276 antigen-like [Leptodactylus fuscus]|uniref:CD276 antigen-like n=1 Tax=Leptodactylus fuscus TaxID=238119 RepID=UPI003F4EF9F3
MIRVVVVTPLILCLVKDLEGFMTCPVYEQTVSFPPSGTATLPCSFIPSEGFSGRRIRVSWQKKHGGEELVVHFQNGRDTGDMQNEVFRGRTTMSNNWFGKGDATLTLRQLTMEDAGKYTCWVTVYPISPGLQKRCCVVMLNISAELASQGSDHAHPLWERALGHCIFILAVALLCFLPFFWFYKRYFRSSNL